MDELPSNSRAIYMKSLRVGQMTELPLEHEGRYILWSISSLTICLRFAGGFHLESLGMRTQTFIRSSTLPSMILLNLSLWKFL
jgi:hypothetical protein